MYIQNSLPKDFTDLVHEMKIRGDAFAVATVVRTVSVTAAKPGAKAIINENGEIIEGWIGGGCARHAVLKAALQSIEDGETRLVSIKPEELIQEHELGRDEAAGIVVARNMCPSKGSMEIFVEPVLANPSLLVMGSSPVANALAQIAGTFDLTVAVYGGKQRLEQDPMPYRVYGDKTEIDTQHPHRYIVVATQGSGDTNALELALTLEARHIAFVGSARKIAHLREQLVTRGAESHWVERINSPAGIDIGAVTPQEIALSILADIVRIRRSHSINRNKQP